MAGRALRLGVLALLLTACATGGPRGGVASPGTWVQAEGTGGAGAPYPSASDAGARPEGWPDFAASAEALLAPLLACDSPAGFLELQRGVDMPRLVEALEDWRAVRLGARGPMREEAAARVLQRKRAALYMAYYERRIGELKAGTSSKGPLRWEAYGRMWGGFIRGLEFERRMVKVLRADAALPRAERRYLRDFERPRVETSVGVTKPGTGLCFADVLVIEEGESAGRPRRVETFSFKSRELAGLRQESLKWQLLEDAREAARKYGGRLDIRRESLRILLGERSEMPVQRTRLIYEGGGFAPELDPSFKVAIEETAMKVPEVEVSFQ